LRDREALIVDLRDGWRLALFRAERLDVEASDEPLVCAQTCL
jgi:hypothetical protein